MMGTSPTARHRFEQMAAAYLQRMGERLRARRDELGLSRSDVARQLPGKTNENAVYRWEKGQHRPNDDTLEALAGVLKTTVSYFLTDEPEKSATPDPFGDSINGVGEELGTRQVTRRLATLEQNQLEIMAIAETALGLLRLLVPDEQALVAESLLDQLNVAREIARDSVAADEGPATKANSG